MKWYHKAADAGNVGAMVGIGTLYQVGQGVDRDYHEAMAWYRKAADAKDVIGIVMVANLYEDGLGVPKDLKAAHVWYQQAADAGDKDAKQWLADHPPSLPDLPTRPSVK